VPVSEARADERIDEATGEHPAGPVTSEVPVVRRRSWAAVLGIWAILAVPFVVALAALRRTRWYPTLDLAMTELRVRDVGGRHTPLIGLPGRIGTIQQQGSHPGPLSFWGMAPVYRLLGSTAWAMQAAGVSLHLLAIGVCLWIANRRGGRPLLLAVGAVLALLTWGYGPLTLTDPWNPYLPLLAWFAFLLAIWSVVCDDLALLPVAVVAGSFCAQTHLPYLGLCGGLGAAAVAVVLVDLWRRRVRAGAAPARGIMLDTPRHAGRWFAISGALAVLLWIPPVIDQLTHTPGNFRLLWHHFLDPTEPAAGSSLGVKLLVQRLNVFRFFAPHHTSTGSLTVPGQAVGGTLVPGLLLLAAWVACVAVAFRRRHRPLLRLHLLVGAAVVLGAFSISHIFGSLWYYLMIWAYGITALAAVAIGWTITLVVADRLAAPQRARAARAGGYTLVGVTIVATLLFSVDASHTKAEASGLSRTIGLLLPDTVRALDAGTGSATGRDGTYSVTWSDALAIGSQAYGLVDELERAGFHVGVPYRSRAPVTNHRVVDPATATAVVHWAAGPSIEQWRNFPGSVQVAYVEPRTPAQQAEYAQLRADVITDLRRLHLDDIVPIVDANLFGAGIDPRVPKHDQDLMGRMATLGIPAAIFVAPPGTGE
jgi:hypothetical protein